MKRYLMTVVLLFAAAIAGFTMPSKLLEWEDAHRIDHLEMQSSEKVLLTAQTNMTLIEKILLLQNDMVATLAMAEGKNYTSDGIFVQVQNELQVLSKLGIIELERFDLNFGIEDILFLVDIQGGTQSMLLWKVYAVTENGLLRMTVDDETGKILTLTYTEEATKAVSSDSEFFDLTGEPVDDNQDSPDSGQIKRIAEKWAEYLDVELVETSVFDRTIVSGYDEIQKEIDQLVEKGIDRETAEDKIYEEWGYAGEEFYNRRIYATYEDESGIVMYGFRINTGEIVFSADIYN